MVASKQCNAGKGPNEMYLFHGPRENTSKILQSGFKHFYAKSKPYGVWFSTQSSYSGSSFAEVLADQSRRIFICKVICGTPGQDDGTGFRPNAVTTGEPADCHFDGASVYIIYEDAQAYPEYLIHWK